MVRRNTLDMTQGPIVKKLFAFAIPVLFTLVLQQLYTLADRAVVGQFAKNGDIALAAIGATSAITAMIVNMSNGLASGLTVRCANLKGANDETLLRKSMHTGVLLSIVAGFVLGVIGIVVSKPLLQLLDTPESILEKSTLYLQVYFAGFPATVIYNFGAAILRSFGDAKRPMYILLFSGILNIALNLILVIVCKMDVAGVAIATAAAQTFATLVVLRILFSKNDAYCLSFKKLRFHGPSLKVIVRIGIPNGINGILFSLSNMIIQSSINSFDNTAIIAGKTAAQDVASLIYQIIHAFALACVSFSGQCFGAKKYKRIDKLTVQSVLSCGAVVAVMCTFATVFSDFCIGIFNSKPEVIEAGRNLMLILIWSYLLYLISDLVLSCTRGFGKSLSVTIINVVALLAPRLIWIWFFFPFHKTIEYLYWCYPISYVISSIAQIIYYILLRKKLDRKLAAEQAAAQLPTEQAPAEQPSAI